MERIAWALIRCQLRFELSVELRICLETLWALPAPNTPFDVTLLPSSVLVGIDGTVELAVPYPADQRYFQRYLAPELAGAETATVASAIYAVGALLFEAVSGGPFESSTAVEREVDYLAARAQATGIRPDATDTRLLEIAARATRQNPDERWATPELFSREIDRVASHRMATREELAGLVLGWVQQSRRSRTDPSAALRRRASVFPPPLVEAELTGARRKLPLPRKDAGARLRNTTLRGYSLDLSSYPPARPTQTSPTQISKAAAVARESNPVAVASVAPESGVRLTEGSHTEPARQRATDHRTAALITALVVAIPLVGMTLWNWHASAHAAHRSAVRTAERAPVAARVPRERTATSLVPTPRATKNPKPPACGSCREDRDGAAPLIDLTSLPPRSEPAPAVRRSPRPPKFRGPDDYGI